MVDNHNNDFILKVCEYFKALGDVNRLKIIKVLTDEVKNKISVTDLSVKLNISQPAVSQHIKILRQVEILKLKKEGNRNYYYINENIFESIKNDFEHLYNITFEVSSMENKK
jgi:ArsR family transcriptional regulator